MSCPSEGGISAFGISPKCARCAAYAAVSASIASIVAASGSIRTRPENTALSPIASSRMKVGRCETWWARNSAVVACSFAAISADSARARSFFAFKLATLAATATASAIRPTLRPSRSPAWARASRTSSPVAPRLRAASATALAAG